jgi:hypothetical protein
MISNDLLVTYFRILEDLGLPDIIPDLWFQLITRKKTFSCKNYFTTSLVIEFLLTVFQSNFPQNCPFHQIIEIFLQVPLSQF